MLVSIIMSRSESDEEQMRFNANVIALKDEKKGNDYFTQFTQQFGAEQDSDSLQEAKQELFLRKCAKAKSNIKHSPKTSAFKNVPKYTLSYQDGLFTHFDTPYQQIIEKYLHSDSLTEQKVDALKRVQGKLDELFQSDVQLQYTSDTKNLAIKPAWKKKELLEVDGIEVEDYMLDHLSKDHFVEGSELRLNQYSDYQEEDTRGSLMRHAMENFADIVHTDPEEENSEWFRNAYVRHALQHIRRKPNAEDEAHKGFTRCKVLILAPFRGDAVEIINTIISEHTDEENKVKNHEKYSEEYLDDDRASEDDFRIGIALFPKKFIKLYSAFDKSDIIVASPLGLKLITESETHFLSSIEICIIDRASVIFMQNWSHLLQVLTQLNTIPEHKHITSELLLIRPYFFEGLAKFYRQTIVYSDNYFTQLNQVRTTHMNNYKGCLSNRLYYLQLVRSAEQEFVNFDVSSVSLQFEQRMSTFKKFWNTIEQQEQYRKMVVFVSSYFDFVKIKNYLKSINSKMEWVSEYTPKNKVQGVLARFNKNKIDYLMVTERAYFFEVCQIERMKHLFFYQLPHNRFIYQQLVEGIYDEKQKKQPNNVFQTNSKTKIVSLYCKYDGYQLEQIVGTEKAEEMLDPSNRSSSFII